MGEDRKVENIVSERLILREISEEDTDDIVEMRSNEDVYRFFCNPHKITKEEHLNWFRNSYVSNPDRIDFIAVIDESGQSSCKVGVFGIVREKDITEINYILKEDARGKGYASEAVKAVMDYSVREWNNRNFVAVIHKENIPSIQFIERLGFSAENTEGDFINYVKKI